MEKEPLVVSNKSCKTYFLLDESKVYFTGDFDSGNLERVQKLSPSTFRVTPGFDKTRQSTRKTYFHFKTHGFKHCTIRFIVTRAYLLEHLIRNDEGSDVYHPVVKRTPHGQFQKITKDVRIYYNPADEPELSFCFQYDHEGWVEFAFTYPYSYEDNENLIKKMREQVQKHPDIYFHDEVLCRTSQHRKVHIVTISDKRNCKTERQETIQGLFEQDQRPFKIDKPTVVISARVHPGQTPASHCMQGVIRFLLNEKDDRSYLLRKNFHFILIPMLNPQGVFEGMFRNDLFGENLNRMYVHCDPRKQYALYYYSKSIWSVKKYLQSLKRVDFFFDLHAHPSRKGFFIYGNAFQEFIQQVEAQIFSKMIEYNCPYFENLDCIYTEKAMVEKDKHDNFNKQGCARVFYHRLFKLIHSFTVQCGYFAPTKLNPYPPQREFTNPGSIYNCTTDWESFSMKEYTPESYMMLGKSLLISVMDLFHINPYTRISTSDFKSINSLRKFTAQRVFNEVQRFKMVDSNCYKKIKSIDTLIEQNYYLPRFKAYGLTISQNFGMRNKKKKTFSLNSKVRLHGYSRIQSKSRLGDKEQIQLKTEQNQVDMKEEQIIEVNPQYTEPKQQKLQFKSMSQKHLKAEQFLQPFSKFEQITVSPQIDKQLRSAKMGSLHKPIDISHAARQSSGQHSAKSHFSKQERYPQLQKLRKIDVHIVSQLLRSKLRSEYTDSKKSFESLIRIDRLDAMLRKDSKKTSRFPPIHPNHFHEHKTDPPVPSDPPK